MSLAKSLQENFPFITGLKYKDYEYVGIIINSDAQVTSFYDFSEIKSDQEKAQFLELGEIWWWESNRKIPITIFLKNEISAFRCYIKTLNTKDTEIIFGPTVNLSEIATKRVKRKSIQLVRSLKKSR